MRHGSSGWPASISAGFLPACMPWVARCCRCPADAAFIPPARTMRRSQWRATAGCAGLDWQSQGFRAVIHGVAKGGWAVSIQCHKCLKRMDFSGIEQSRLARVLWPCLTTCKWEIKTGRIGIPASARTVPARRTQEASRNDRDSRKSSIHRRHRPVVKRLR